MTLVALPCAVVSYTTCELVTSVTVTSGGGTVWAGEKECVVYIQYVVVVLQYMLLRSGRFHHIAACVLNVQICSSLYP